MSQSNRLPHGGTIDRSRKLAFEFDGRRFTGHPGDTLASALLANGVHLVGRSFKYHRPRGILGAGVEEPNALVTVHRGPGRDDPNTRATAIALFDGLSASSQNRRPSLRFDVGAVNSWLSPLLPAGFYYKTFLWPRSAWHRFYEPWIRSKAGLGPAPTLPDPDCYAQRFAHCDLLIVGGGPAGLAAADSATAQGQRVILCDERDELGSTLVSSGEALVEGLPAAEWRRRLLEALATRPNLRILPRTTAFGYFAQNFVGLLERLGDQGSQAHSDPIPPTKQRAREKLWQVRASRVILATGAIERPLVFAGNDRPGVMLASAAQSYIRQYAVLPGRRVMVCVADDSGYEAAIACRQAGAEVAVSDVRMQVTEAQAASARAAGIEDLPGCVPTGTGWKHRVHSLRVHQLHGDGSFGRRRIHQCDLVLMAGGWTPTVHLHSQSRGTVAWNDALQAFVPDRSVQDVESAGACRGLAGLGSCVADGRAVVTAGAARSPLPATSRSRLAVLPGFAEHDAETAFVDFQNDVTVRDIRLAIREGFTSAELFKRYTTLGMATDQGRTSNLNGLAVAADALGCTAPQVGLTTFRAPYTPVTFGTLAGQQRGLDFEPVRVTPIHQRAVALGAVFEDVGQWKRARFFPNRGEGMHAAVARECRATRESVGIFDASTLGKIEVVGPDAAEFMDRIYINAWSRLQPGRCRYGVMVRDDGFIYDDGVVGRLAPDRFHVTTTTTGAARVLHHMEDYLQTEFSGLRAWLTSTTEQWAVIAVQGPNARRVLAPLVHGIDLERESFPHMAVRMGWICGVATRLFRVSFTGELGFEINVPAAWGAMIWEAVYAEALRYDGVAYGTETMHVLRAEKGYIIVGQETDGTVTAADVGLDGLIGKDKGDFVGKRSLQRASLQTGSRKTLVGLLSCDGRSLLEEGAQILGAPLSHAVANRSIGHVTSAYESVACGRPIALALLSDGRARVGQTVHVTSRHATIAAKVTGPVFYDPEGARLAS